MQLITPFLKQVIAFSFSKGLFLDITSWKESGKRNQNPVSQESGTSLQGAEQQLFHPSINTTLENVAITSKEEKVPAQTNNKYL